uniref:uncharacterized protein LOC117611490 n=1 Tax=Osmia lignaria TaxID=473952 RepID=UPI0014797775|nr:uncharacterized protein LOC117611490 [Osmia lignaria]
MALAGVVPFKHEAEAGATLYWRLRGHRQTGEAPPEPAVEQEWRHQARQNALDRWRRELIQSGAAGQRAVGAVLPVINEWRDRGFGRVTYRTTQVLTGHGCFGDYLCRIGREATPICHHCGAERDSAQHTLQHCPVFARARHALECEVGPDLSPEAVVRAMLSGEDQWRAVTSFCEEVIALKEEAERGREES